MGIQGLEEMAQWVKFKHEDLHSDPPAPTLKKKKNKPVCTCKPSAGMERQVDPCKKLSMKEIMWTSNWGKHVDITLWLP